MSIAKRVSEEMEVRLDFQVVSLRLALNDVQCKLGSTVGYAIRFEDCTSAETKIKCKHSSISNFRSQLMVLLI
jgi:HrpA-like RNA helicase